ncbi:MAG: tetratricopeptide repeat protein [Candidatus Thorarchaeota archaeon]|nr:tetratricopeptide repeat protein [Candidatus Thorarchaeota archaeon]
MHNNPIIPEFMMYTPDLEDSEIDEIRNRLAAHARSTKDRFLIFTDVLIEYVGGGEWRNRSPAFLAMCGKACFLRGKYGFNQILARESQNLSCKGYAAAAYCRQSLDPRWLNNLRNITNQTWQAKDYIAFAELSGQLASVLMDLGYTDHARQIASESIDKVTVDTAQDPKIRTMVQAALLRPRIILAFISGYSDSREESLIRLDSAHDTASLLDHQLALNDIRYYRARALEDMFEHDRALSLVTIALREYERMGYLKGVADARNLRGVIHLNLGQLQEARDQFEELLIIQQQLNNQVGLAATLVNVGEIDRALDQIDQMEIYNRRALEISQEAEYMRGITISTLNLGDVALRRGDVQEALRLYKEAIKLAEGAGMKQVLSHTYFLAGDAYILQQDFEQALQNYEKGRQVALEVAHKLYAFNAEISTLVTQWMMKATPDADLIGQIRKIMGSSSNWMNASDSQLMRNVRRIVLEDPASDSELCIFYDGEKGFECRVERQVLRKECFGNLFWMGYLCPHFRAFITKLEG